NRVHGHAVELLTAAEEFQFDDGGDADERGVESANEVRRGADGAAGGEQIVDDEHAIVRRQRVVVNLECVAAVFENVFVAASRVRQFVGLADRNGAGAEV